MAISLRAWDRNPGFLAGAIASTLVFTHGAFQFLFVYDHLKKDGYDAKHCVATAGEGREDARRPSGR